MRLRMVEGNAARRASLRFSWRTAPTGTKWLRLTRGEAVNVYYWKTKKSWSYFTDADGKETYRNDFDTELEAMLAAEEDLGDRVVVDERQQPARRPTLTVVVKPKAEVEPEVEVEPQEPAQTLSAKRSRNDYLKALNGNDPSPWGNVLFCLAKGSFWHDLFSVSFSSGVALSDIESMVSEYDQEIVEVLRDQNGKVRITLKEEEASA